MGYSIEGIMDGSPLVVEGRGEMTANALMKAGLGGTSMAIVEPVSGTVDLGRTPQEILTVADPSLKLERDNQPANTMGIMTPSMMSGPGR